MSGKDKKRNGGNLTVNRRATHDYFVLERMETGIELVGTEVKVVRNGEAGLTGSYAQVKNGQLFLNQVTIPPYAFGNRFNHDSLRTRRLLVHKREIRKLQAMSEQKGLSLIPLRLYLSPKGLVKVELGVCRGKAQEDKRESIKRREADLEARRAISKHYRG
ncbi:MAG TPA: SsrA-binding protein SmpB [Kiritimatiellia bacterium]|jgi:SsrA-binding protein|nr:SsrA-binding protein SmpB [Kiritimatiellia bacterium]NLC80632.1 SsrA-binding protein SmpB [Lentisphaerota bacterium]MDD4172920.1 SsrA-binding protein SmpB [Kiritimatiellia bacterium]MDD4440440.1 SsrA-binding protein SmpB [Kiritimatiellia bacterium]HPB12230.1 SsrA-binding protein SmpB [Kiritimatiellia bacterium]